MRQHLDNLRERPKEVRAHVALIAAFSVTGLIFGVWVLGLGARMSVESSDPVIAQYERELAAQEAANNETETGVGAMFGNLRRGAAAIIFSGSDEAVTEEEAAARDGHQQ